MRKTSQGGRRGRNRQDKLDRLKDAAWTMFTERGYDTATVRDIAQHAGVAVGTVFLYARDKPELLLLAYNHQHEQLLQQVALTLPGTDHTADLLHLLTPLPTLYAPHRHLALRYIAEATAVTATPIRQHTRSLASRLHRHIARATVTAVHRGELQPGTPAALVAQNTLGLLLVNLTSWLPTTAPLGRPPLTNVSYPSCHGRQGAN